MLSNRPPKRAWFRNFFPASADDSRRADIPVRHRAKPDIGGLWHTNVQRVTFVPMNGILNLNKPAGISSAAAVAKIKRLLPRGTKIGHAGTLDPFATGVLLLLIGKATKLCEKLMDEPKQYQATIKLGATTETLDPQSEEVADPNAKP